MSNYRLPGILTACAIAIIVTILLIHFEPWVGTPSVETYMLTTYVSPLAAGFVSSCDGEYEFGEQVVLTASPASGYTFDHWSGGASGNSTTITITMNQNYPIIANFAAIVLNPLTLVSPADGATDVPTKKIGFAWTSVAGADEYYFVLSANPDLSVSVVEATAVTRTAYSCAGNGVKYDTTYYWQVKALNGSSVISESTIGIFRTEGWCCP